MLENYKNYYVYAPFIQNKQNIQIYVPDINASNIIDHYNGILSIAKDGIDDDYFHNLLVNISWDNGINCDLYIVDYLYNLIMWLMLLKADITVKPCHIFYDPSLTRDDLTGYINEFLLIPSILERVGFHRLNEIIDDSMYLFTRDLEPFSYYLANTINNEDNIVLMNASPEYNQLLHCSLADVPFDKVKEVGMQYTNQAINIIKNSKDIMGYDHGLTASFNAREAVNPRQFKEALFNIGTKPNGSGGIFPYVIDSNFANGGVNTPLNYYIESSSARTAQILSKINIGDSGDFARILGLNNTDTFLFKPDERYPDLDYDCGSQNYIKYTVKSAKHLKSIRCRYYRHNPNGMEHMTDGTDTDLIGKTIYLRSPITCAGPRNGMGICRKCYGDLYHINYDVNIGKIAAEILSSQLSQRLLSAKHLLETEIRKMQWNAEFEDYFIIDVNSIVLNELDDTRGYLLIDPNDITLVGDEEDAALLSGDTEDEELEIDDTGVYSEYITHFFIKTPMGSQIEFKTNENEPLYISNELNSMIRRKASPDNGIVKVPLSSLSNIPLFYIRIINNEMSKTMNDIMNVLDKSSITEVMTKDQAVQEIVDLVISGGISVNAVHLEVLLSNQVVSVDDIFKKPDWTCPNVPYRMLTLNHALSSNPSTNVTLLYKDLGKTLYSPLTFKKHAPSFFDLFFMEKPQEYISGELLDDNPAVKTTEDKILLNKDIDPDKRENKKV